MILVLKRGTTREAVEELRQWTEQTYDTSAIEIPALEMRDAVERVMKVSEPFKRANRKFHPDDTVVAVGDRHIGDRRVLIAAGPCSVESEEQVCGIAQSVAAAGAGMLRGGAYKPRTSPYSFQGLRAEGLLFMKKARDITGMPVVSEITNPSQIELFDQYVDVVQVGTRNMQNFELLKELGRIRKPILLKRGFANTIEEMLMSAEYIMSGGNTDVILCERGIRTFETSTRNTLDISAIPVIKRLSHLPVFVDPSHASGMAWLVEPLSMAAIAAGADGLIIEVHNDPQNALSDGQQSLTPEQFAALMERLRPVAAAVGRAL